MSQLPIAKKYDFKSVGRTQNEFESALVNKAKNLPIGIKTPMELSVGGNAGPFAMRDKLVDQIKDNFRNMLATNHGDRLMLHDFGANLERLAFELCAEAGDTKAINQIRKTTEKYMPYVSLDTFESFREEDEVKSGMANIRIRVVFGIPKLGVTNQGVEVIIYSAG